MLLSKKVMARWNGATRKWYEDRGYVWTKQNDWFECDIDDFMTTSPVKVLVKCDYCGEEFEKPYRDLFKQREFVNKDCCGNRKCMVSKSEEINIIKYGVKNHMQTQESKDHLSKYNRTDWDIVTKAFNDKGLDLISNESDYRNDRSRLKFICRIHSENGVQETNYQNVKSQKHCCKYGGIDAVANARRLDGEVVYNAFIEAGLIPKFNPEDYSRNDDPLPYLCPKHEDKGIQYRQYGNLHYSDGCMFCAAESTASKLRLDKNFVFDYFKERGLIVKDDEYIGKDVPINYECMKHRGFNQKVSFHSLKNTKCPCSLCREEKYLTKLSRTIRSSLSWWRKYSKKLFKNTCLLTGTKGNIEIHHQKQLDTIIRDALSELGLEVSDVYNGEDVIAIKEKVSDMHKSLPVGVCINKDIHILFHVEYGKSQCTKIDFEDFMYNYFEGKYDEKLKEELKSFNSKTNYEEAKKLASFYYAEN